MRRGNKQKFGRIKKQREALYKALATALIDHGRIKTTVAKAKTISSHIERLVTKSIKGDLASRKFILQFIGEEAARKLVSEIGPRFKDKKGGYTRIIKLGHRGNDSAPMAIIEFVS